MGNGVLLGRLYHSPEETQISFSKMETKNLKIISRIKILQGFYYGYSLLNCWNIVHVYQIIDVGFGKDE